MTYPTRSDVHAMFLNLRNPPTGTATFWDSHVSPSLLFTVTGNHALSGTFRSKAAYRAGTWASITALVAEPGIKLELPNGEDSIVVGNEGHVVVEMRTVDTWTVRGDKYEQEYVWVCKFSEEGVIMEIRAYLDSVTLERVLLGKESRDRTVEG